MRIFIGYDPRQIVSYNVLHNSIIRRASKPVSITPLILETLPIKKQGLTPFTYSRFLCPWLCKYQGVSAFLDADILAMGDICNIEAFVNPNADVSIVQHSRKFEWSSVMIFNNARCTNLTPEYIEGPKNPMNFEWANSMGVLPSSWNHLVGYDPPRKDAHLVHFTQGVPIWPETAQSEYADEWRAEYLSMMSAKPWDELMGNSVHAKPVLDRLEKTA